MLAVAVFTSDSSVKLRKEFVAFTKTLQQTLAEFIFPSCIHTLGGDSQTLKNSMKSLCDWVNLFLEAYKFPTAQLNGNSLYTVSRDSPVATAKQTRGYEDFPEKRNCMCYTDEQIRHAGCPKAEPETLEGNMTKKIPRCLESPELPEVPEEANVNTDDSFVILRDLSFHCRSP